MQMFHYLVNQSTFSIPVTVNDMTVGLTGQEVYTASQGTAKAPNETVLPSGLSIHFSNKGLQ